MKVARFLQVSRAGFEGCIADLPNDLMVFEGEEGWKFVWRERLVPLGSAGIGLIVQLQIGECGMRIGGKGQVELKS